MRSVNQALVVATIAAVLPGCAPDGEGVAEHEESAWAADSDYDRRLELEIAIPGAWSLPPDVHAVAQTQFVAYDGAPPWDGGANCSGTFYSGTGKLREYLLDRYPGISSIGGYSCRPNTANPSLTSVHGIGRALDVMIPTIGGDADNTVGDAIANWLIMNAEHIGIQLVIWDRSSWNASRSGEKMRAYTGPIPHIDHLHVELTIEAGVHEQTPFFEGGAPHGTVGDVDGDGRADLVTAHSDGNAFVYAGGANGSLTNATASFGGTLDSALVDGIGHFVIGVADVTGDGLSDLVSVHSDGSATVWPGLSSRNFGGAVSSFGGTMALAAVSGSGHDPVALADVNGDGHADLITIHTNGNAFTYLGTATGMFGGPAVSFGGTLDSALRDGVGHWVVGAADVTGDGRADLVTVHSDGNAYVYTGNPAGAFAGGAASFAGTMDLSIVDGQQGHVPVGVGDVDGDGRSDLITHHTDGNVFVYGGTSGGDFVGGVASFAGTMAMGQFGGPGHQVVGVLDVTGDGRVDLITAHPDGNAYVYAGTATGAFIGAAVNFAGTLDSSFTDDVGHELVQMGPWPRRRVCSVTGCVAP